MIFFSFMNTFVLLFELCGSLFFNVHIRSKKGHLKICKRGPWDAFKLKQTGPRTH